MLTTTPLRPHLLYKIKYFLSLAALQLGAPNENFKIFDARHVEYDIIKCFFTEKRRRTCIFIKRWLDHLQLMMLCLLIIETNSQQTCVKMWVRGLRTATENGNADENRCPPL